MTTKIINSKKRIVLIDALRGYALLGLFIVHMVEYFELYWYNPQPTIYKDLAFGVFGGKAYAIFALLFGLSFFIIMDSKKQQGIDFRGRFIWRLILLLIFGLLHSIIYGGDILQILAITGLFLVPIYTLRDRLLLVLAFLLLLQVPAIIYFLMSDIRNSTEPLHWSQMATVHNVYANGSFTDVVRMNTMDGFFAKWVFSAESGRLSTITGISFFGFWLGKIGFFKESGSFKAKYKVYFLISLVATVILYFGKSYLYELINPNEYWLVNSILDNCTNLIYIAFSVLTFVYLFQIEIFHKILSHLAASGRMSLTIYIFQSLVFVPIFYGYGLNAFTYLGQAWSFFLGVILFMVQIWLAKLWFKNYYYGPLEWIWRSATYLRSDIKFKKR